MSETDLQDHACTNDKLQEDDSHHCECLLSSSQGLSPSEQFVSDIRIVTTPETPITLERLQSERSRQILKLRPTLVISTPTPTPPIQIETSEHLLVQVKIEKNDDDGDVVAPALPPPPLTSRQLEKRERVKQENLDSLDRAMKLITELEQFEIVDKQQRRPPPKRAKVKNEWIEEKLATLWPLDVKQKTPTPPLSKKTGKRSQKSEPEKKKPKDTLLVSKLREATQNFWASKQRKMNKDEAVLLANHQEIFHTNLDSIRNEKTLRQGAVSAVITTTISSPTPTIKMDDATATRTLSITLPSDTPPLPLLTTMTTTVVSRKYRKGMPRIVPLTFDDRDIEELVSDIVGEDAAVVMKELELLKKTETKASPDKAQDRKDKVQTQLATAKEMDDKAYYSGQDGDSPGDTTPRGPKLVKWDMSLAPLPHTIPDMWFKPEIKLWPVQYVDDSSNNMNDKKTVVGTTQVAAPTDVVVMTELVNNPASGVTSGSICEQVEAHELLMRVLMFHDRVAQKMNTPPGFVYKFTLPELQTRQKYKNLLTQSDQYLTPHEKPTALEIKENGGISRNPRGLCGKQCNYMIFPPGYLYRSHLLKQSMVAKGNISVCLTSGQSHHCNHKGCTLMELDTSKGEWVCPVSGLVTTGYFRHEAFYASRSGQESHDLEDDLFSRGTADLGFSDEFSDLSGTHSAIEEQNLRVNSGLDTMAVDSLHHREFWAEEDGYAKYGFEKDGRDLPAIDDEIYLKELAALLSDDDDNDDDNDDDDEKDSDKPDTDLTSTLMPSPQPQPQQSFSQPSSTSSSTSSSSSDRVAESRPRAPHRTLVPYRDTINLSSTYRRKAWFGGHSYATHSNKFSRFQGMRGSTINSREDTLNRFKTAVYLNPTGDLKTFMNYTEERKLSQENLKKEQQTLLSEHYKNKWGIHEEKEKESTTLTTTMPPVSLQPPHPSAQQQPPLSSLESSVLSKLVGEATAISIIKGTSTRTRPLRKNSKHLKGVIGVQGISGQTAKFKKIIEREVDEALNKLCIHPFEYRRYSKETAVSRLEVFRKLVEQPLSVTFHVNNLSNFNPAGFLEPVSTHEGGRGGGGLLQFLSRIAVSQERHFSEMVNIVYLSPEPEQWISQDVVDPMAQAVQCKTRHLGFCVKRALNYVIDLQVSLPELRRTGINQQDIRVLAHELVILFDSDGSVNTTLPLPFQYLGRFKPVAHPIPLVNPASVRKITFNLSKAKGKLASIFRLQQTLKKLSRTSSSSSSSRV